MRLLKLPWRGRTASDELDPELLATFDGASSIPEPGRPDLARARTRVASSLEGRATAGGLRKRLPLAAFGGGGMWASLVGVAAAHKIAAIGLGVAALVGAGTAAQTGGLGAVLDATGIHASQPGQGHGRSGGDDGDDGDGDVSVGATSLHESGIGPAGDSEAAVAVSDAPEDLPGNLVTQVHDGSFTLRAVLCAIDGEGGDPGTVTLATAGDCEEAEGGVTAGITVAGGGNGLITLTLDAEATVSVPGTRSPNGGKPEVATGPSVLPTLSDHAGRLAFVRGTCEEGETLEDCTVTSIHVLGQAGQGEPEGSGESLGAGAGDKPSGEPPYGSPPEGAGPTATDDDLDGPPFGDGKPETVPPVLTPGSQGD